MVSFAIILVLRVEAQVTYADSLLSNKRQIIETKNAEIQAIQKRKVVPLEKVLTSLKLQRKRLSYIPVWLYCTCIKRNGLLNDVRYKTRNVYE